MVAHAPTKPITLDDLRAVDGLDEYKGMEIVDGVWTPKHEEGGMSAGHSRYGLKLLRILDDFVREHKLGEICMAETIFVLHVVSPTVRVVRKPDIAFVSTPKVVENPTEYYMCAPDLAVEVLSPSDTPEVIYGKLRDYFTYGTQQVWLLNFKQQKLVVHFPDGTGMTYGVGEQVPGGDLLPGFTLDVATVFER